MRHGLLFLPAIGLLTIGGFRAAAQSSQDLLDRLTTKIQSDADAAKNAVPPPAPDGSTAKTPAEIEARRGAMFQQNTNRSNAQFLLGILNSARFYVNAGQEDAAIQQFESVRTNTTDQVVRDAAEAVIQKIQSERTAKEAALTAEVADILKRAGEAVVKAKVPKDLDATLQELSREADNPALSRAFANRNEPFTNRLKSAARFVGRLQDCLVFIGHNDNKQAAETLRAMLSDNGDAILAMGVPRTEIINRISAASDTKEPGAPPLRRTESEINADVAAVLDRLHTLDDLPAAIRALMALYDETITNSARGYSTSNRANQINNTLSRLHSLEKSYAELQHGLGNPQDGWFARDEGQSDLPDESVLAVLRAQLITLSLPRLLGAPDTEKPAPGERVDSFLDRLIGQARKRSDWPAVARGLEYRRLLLNPRSPYGGSQFENGHDDVTAFKQFLAGQNFEQAAQYEQAVVAYLSALGTGSQEIPAALISERLTAIQQAHPKEYAGGQRAVDPGNESAYGNAVRAYRRQLQLEEDATGSSSAPAAPVALSVSPAKVPQPSPSVSLSPSPSPTPAASATPSPSP